MDDNLNDLMFGLELEYQWRDYQPRLTDKELLETFPEAKSILRFKIKEWQECRKQEALKIKDKLRLMREKSPPEDWWFWRAVIKHRDMLTLLAADKHILRLKRLRNLAENKPTPKGWISQDQIVQASTVSTANFASQYTKLRRRGQTLVGLCPLHGEKSPSFTIYQKDNRWHCFGCNRHGNVINLTQNLLGVSFLAAVRYLLNY